MGSINCHVCEEVNIDRLNCNGLCHGEDEDNKKGVVLVHTEGQNQFVVLNTPFVELTKWIVNEDLDLSTFTVFFRDDQKNIRCIVHHEPHDRHFSLSHYLPEQKECEVHQGILFEDLFPPHLRKHMLRFMDDTLKGTYYQMHALFNSVAKLIRTFPIVDYNNNVVGGIMMVGTFSEYVDNQILGSTPADDPPESQEMSLDTNKNLAKKNKKHRAENRTF
jgi:hypothetical protein